MAYNSPGAYQAPQYPPGYTPKDPNAAAKIIAIAVIVAGYASAALGMMGAFFIFGVGGQGGQVGPGGAQKTYEFMTSAGAALGIGAIAVAGGYLLRARAAQS